MLWSATVLVLLWLHVHEPPTVILPVGFSLAKPNIALALRVAENPVVYVELLSVEVG